ncbi:helix-turn-helix domain-containing protein [Neobacillus mesonae]|nr:helix-turn-helix domain-containing protein [Neobacillus mesonae]
MDCNRVGQLILNLRKEKNMTQNELALQLNISDKTISKWERGLGCPDVTLLSQLSSVLGVNIEEILSGDLQLNDQDNGNLKRIHFYNCQSCGNVITSTGAGHISCCGRILKPLSAKSEDMDHKLTLEEIENDFYVTFQHEMNKGHYISFVAYVSYDRLLFVKLYPEQNSELRFPKMYGGGTLYFNCSQHGLWKHEIKNRK